jgi:hypothetical protein
MRDIDFLIIGAAKSATTWLQRSLQAVPSIYMPNPELHFFSREYHRGRDWYQAHFTAAGEATVVGEKSNSYLDTAEAAGRIHRDLPSVKLVAQLRNPIDRAYSDYCMLLRRGAVSSDIDRHLDPRKADNSRFLTGGFYLSHVERYLELYPVEALLLLLFEDVRSDPKNQVARVLKFLGLDAKAAAVPIDEKIKDKNAPVLSPTLRRMFRPLKPVVAPFRDSKYFKAIRGAIARQTPYPPLTESLKDRLADFYRADATGLGKLMGRDLSVWLERPKLPDPSSIEDDTPAKSGS